MPEKDPWTKRIPEDEAMAYLAAIVDSSDASIVSKTLEGVITSWNRGAERIYGYAEDEVVGRHISVIVPQDRLEELEQLNGIIRKGQRVERLHTQRLRKDGKRIEVSLTLSPIHGRNGDLIGISAIGNDITEQVRLERSLVESEKRYRTLVEMARDAVVVHQDDRFVYANCSALGIYGASSLQELQKLSLLELVHPEEREEVESRLQQLLEGEEIPLREYRLLRIDGQEVAVEASSNLIDYEGRPSIQIIARDISQRKRVELEREAMLKELSYERSRFHTVVRQLPVGIFIAEAPSGKMIFDNDVSRAIFRRQPVAVETVEDYRQWHILTLQGEPYPVERLPLVRALRGETVPEEELQMIRGDGSRGYVRVNAAPLTDSGGAVTAAIAIFNDITEAKLAQQALAASEERLNLALDAAEMGSCDIDLASGSGIWSRRHFLLLGCPPPEGGGGPATMESWLERIHPADRARVVESVAKARREGGILRSEHRVIRLDDRQVIWVNVTGRFQCDARGENCRFIGVIYDVTERRSAEEALRRSEQRFRRMADSMPQIVWTADPDGTVDYFNAVFENYTGLGRESQEVREALGDPRALIALTFHPDDAPKAAQAWARAVASGEEYHTELRLRRADGSYRWHLNRAIPERNETGRIVKWYGTATEIHDLREMQEKLQASEAKFRWLFESNLIAIFFWNRSGEVTSANRAFCELVGCAAGDCYNGKISWRQITPPQECAIDASMMEEILSSGICKPRQKTLLNSRRETAEVPVLIAAARMIGTEAEGIGFAIDLTELTRAEAALRSSEASLKLAIETAQLGIFDWNLKTGEQQWSEIAKAHYGLSRQSEINEDIHRSAVHPDDLERVQQALHEAIRPGGGGGLSLEYRTVGRDDGITRWLTARGQVSYDEHGQPLRLVAACMDITDIVRTEKALKEEISERLRTVEELHRQEQLLIRQGRLAAMGEMIGNIAHQWRQPLNTLGLIVQELPRIYERSQFTKEYLDHSVARAMQVINHMSKTIDGFRNFFGPGKEKETFNASTLVTRTVSMVEAAFAQLNLRIELDLDPEIELFGYPNEFSQVLLNILVNAKDAIVERRVQSPKVVVRLYREDARAVLIIADNAGGIPAEIIEKIFDPYFTTKGPDKGTGIGLFMSKTIIEKNMNGSLTVRNTELGAEFRIEVAT